MSYIDEHGVKRMADGRRWTGPRRADLSGRIFGRLTALEFAGQSGKPAKWLCLCACGKECIAYAANLKSGTHVSCGCYRKELSSLRRGKNHPLWKEEKIDPALRKTAEYFAWRRAVWERDGYQCQMCGKRSGDKNAHHLNCWSLFPEQRYDVSNGVTLCRECHIEFHRDFMGGWRNKPVTADDFMRYQEAASFLI